MDKLLLAPLEEAEFTVVDLETTGFFPHDGEKIIEIGALRLKGSEEVGRFTNLVNPNKKIPRDVMRITHIDQSMVETAPTIDKLIGPFMDFAKDSILVFHNAPFDLSFLVPVMREYSPYVSFNVLDTLMLARRYFTLEFPSKALGNIAASLNIKIENAHRAMDDVEATSKILLHFITDLKRRKKIKTAGDLLKLQGGSVPFPPAYSKKDLKPLIKKANRYETPLKIEYRTEAGDLNIRILEPPIKIYTRGSHALMKGYCREQGGEQKFRIDGILKRPELA